MMTTVALCQCGCGLEAPISQYTNPHAEAERLVNEAHYAERLTKAGVPEHLHGGLIRYLVHRIQPGHFLTAVLENNLSEAMGRADEHSRAGLFNLVTFIYSDAPPFAWGSPEKVAEWLTPDGETDGDQ